MSRFRSRVLTIAQQIACMRAVHPQFRVALQTTARIIWRGALTPTTLSERYEVEICYRLGEEPSVAVLSPVIKEREGHRIPHVYKGNRPCLNVPGAGEWGPDKYIAYTVVGWLSEWLYFYEVWHATGNWLGGGHEPPPSVPEENREHSANPGG